MTEEEFLAITREQLLALYPGASDYIIEAIAKSRLNRFHEKVKLNKRYGKLMVVNGGKQC